MSDFYALHTATNYTGTSNELRGCINDWKNMLILDDFLKIPQENRISLVGSNFKRDMAVQAVDHFATIMEPGDVLIGSNSSHGTFLDDFDGDVVAGQHDIQNRDRRQQQKQGADREDGLGALDVFSQNVHSIPLLTPCR